MFVGTRYMTIINSGRTTRRFVGHAKDVIIVKLLVIGRGGKCRYVLLLFTLQTYALDITLSPSFLAHR